MLSTLIFLTLAGALSLALLRLAYYQFVIMRRFVRPVLQPGEPMTARMTQVMKSSEDRKLRIRWASSFFWTAIFLFAFIMWVNR